MSLCNGQAASPLTSHLAMLVCRGLQWLVDKTPHKAWAENLEAVHLLPCGGQPAEGWNGAQWQNAIR